MRKERGLGLNVHISVLMINEDADPRDAAARYNELQACGDKSSITLTHYGRNGNQITLTKSPKNMLGTKM